MESRFYDDISTKNLQIAYPAEKFPDLIMIYAYYRGKGAKKPHKIMYGLDVALGFAKRNPRPTIVIFGFIPMSVWNTDKRILELRGLDHVHFVEAPLDISAVINAWRTDHGQPPNPDRAPWLPQNSLQNPKARRSKTKNP